MASGQELQSQGIALFEQHDYEAAARSFQQAKDAFAEAKQDDMVAEMKVNIGLVHRALGEYQQALELMQEAVRTFQAQNDQLRTAQVLGNMGGVYAALNDKDKAHSSYRQAADTFKALGETQMYARTLIALGGLQLRSGKYFEGAATFEAAYGMLDHLTPIQRVGKFLFGIIHSIARAAGVKVPGVS
jgi:tetratricopeptide (TPR) repeat protein